MSYDSLADEFEHSAEEFHDLCTKHGFMILPFEPNDADLSVMKLKLPISGGARSYVRDIYEALVERRRPAPEQAALPVKAPLIRQD